MKKLSSKQLNKVQCPICKGDMHWFPEISRIQDGRFLYGDNPKVECKKCQIVMTIWGVSISDYQEFMKKMEEERYQVLTAK